MEIHSLEVHGLRGFSTTQNVEFGVSDGNPGSGLTIFVGPNNGGKSTIVEAIRKMLSRGTKSFTEGERNKNADDRVFLKAQFGEDNTLILKTIEAGGSETFQSMSSSKTTDRVLVLPSRRYFQPFFPKGNLDRHSYFSQISEIKHRSSSMDIFAQRLFKIQDNRESFNKELAKVVDPVPDWYIDLSDSGQYYLKYNASGLYHNSEGLGDGMISLLYIIDSLYDSEMGDTIVIDEPELSLHPAIQRNLSKLFYEYSATRQIIISTHSPYFLDISALETKARVARVYKDNVKGSTISQLSVETGCQIGGLLQNKNNPHVLGLNAREMFFLEDGIILVEGQEDVIFYPIIAQELGLTFRWGVLGADNMEKIAQLFWELDFKRVVGILYKNKENTSKSLTEKFQHYHFFVIPAEDVRSKKERPPKNPIEGLLDHDHRIRPENRESMIKLIRRVNEALTPPTTREP